MENFLQTKFKSEFKKLARFSTVGFIATCVHALIFTIAFQLFFIGSVMSNFIAFCIAVFFSYFGHSHFTFADQIKKENLGWHIRWRFIQTTLFGFLLNTFWAYFFVDYLNWNSIYYILALFTLTPAVSYLLNRYWVFNTPIA